MNHSCGACSCCSGERCYDATMFTCLAASSVELVVDRWSMSLIVSKWLS